MRMLWFHKIFHRVLLNRLNNRCSARYAVGSKEYCQYWSTCQHFPYRRILKLLMDRSATRTQTRAVF